MLAHYVTLAKSANGNHYAPVVVTMNSRTNAPVSIRRHTVRNVLSVAMSYASAKGLAFHLEPAVADLSDEAKAVQAELATSYGITVEVIDGEAMPEEFAFALGELATNGVQYAYGLDWESVDNERIGD